MPPPPPPTDAGPIPVDELREAGEAIKKATLDAFKGLKTAFVAIKDVVKDSLTQMTSFVGVFKGLTTAVEGMPKMVAGIVGGFASVVAAGGALAGAAVEAGNAMAAFVAKANPAAMMMFTNAVDDLMAVIGQALVPIFQLVTQVVRMAADSFQTFATTIGSAIGTALQPVIGFLQMFFGMVAKVGQILGRVAEAAAPALAALGDAFNAVVGAVMPVTDLVIDILGGILVGAMQGLADVVTAAVPYIQAFARVVGELVQDMVKWVKGLLSFIGIVFDETRPVKSGSSVGAAVKGTSIGSIESVISKAQQSAFSIGSGASDPARTTASATVGIKEKVDQIYELMRAGPAAIVAAVLDAMTPKLDKAGGYAPGYDPDSIPGGPKSIDINYPAAVKEGIGGASPTGLNIIGSGDPRGGDKGRMLADYLAVLVEDTKAGRRTREYMLAEFKRLGRTPPADGSGVVK